MRRKILIALTLLAVGCAGQNPEDEASTDDVDQIEDGLMLSGANPLPCADPTVVSEKNKEASWYVYCTGIKHVYQTANWKEFTDVRSSVQFQLAGMAEVSSHVGAWWAPSVTYDRAHDHYVMWVSVLDPSSGGGDARSLAVLTAPSPLGPWNFRHIEKNAAKGQMFIDPSLFRNHNGDAYLFWKQYGGGLPSRLMGARLDGKGLNIVSGSARPILDGFGGSGSWEANCRENPAVWEDKAHGTWHMLFSGNSWRDGAYATGHAVSSCGPLCTSGGGNWHPKSSGNRGVDQVVQAKNLNAFDNGGPGGAEWLGSSGKFIVYAAAARSKEGDKTRYLFRERVRWANGAPYVNSAKHNPKGF